MTSLPNLLRTRTAAFICCTLLPLTAPSRLHCQGGAGPSPSAVQPSAPSVPHPRFRLTPAGPLTLSPDSFPRRLYVRNLSPEPLSVSVRFHEAEPDTASPAVVTSPDTLFLAAGATASFTLDLRLARLRRLPYAGYVYVGARGEETAATVDVTLVRRVKPASSAPPWVARWRTELRRHVVLGGGCERFRLLGTCTRGGVLPLVLGESGGTAAPPVGTVLGFVSDSTGRGAALVSSAGAAPLHGRVEGVRLAFDGLDRVGRYTGEVAPGGPGGARRVSLTVLVTHGALFPVLAMLAGLVLAWPLEASGRTQRARRRFRNDLLRLGEECRQAQAEFESRLGGVPTNYEVGKAVAELRGDYRRRYEALAVEGRAAADREALAGLREDLATTRGQVRQLPVLGAEVARLARALDVIGADGSRAPGARRSRPPAFLEAARRVVAGRPLAPREIPDAIREVAAAGLAIHGRWLKRTPEPGETAPEPAPTLPAAARWTWSLGRFSSPVVLGTVALVVLNERYVAAPAFGTARDYLSVFLWGFGIRAGLEAAKTLGGSLLDRVPTLGSGGG